MSFTVVCTQHHIENHYCYYSQLLNTIDTVAISHITPDYYLLLAVRLNFVFVVSGKEC